MQTLLNTAVAVVIVLCWLVIGYGIANSRR